MSLPIGMYRRAFSYDDALEDPTPMTPPPSDMGSIPWKPVIPERKYQHLAKVSDSADCFWQAQPLCSPSSAPEVFSGSQYPENWAATNPGVFSVPQWSWWAFLSNFLLSNIIPDIPCSIKSLVWLCMIQVLSAATQHLPPFPPSPSLTTQVT